MSTSALSQNYYGNFLSSNNNATVQNSFKQSFGPKSNITSLYHDKYKTAAQQPQNGVAQPNIYASHQRLIVPQKI
jgi:hypothetical protein